MDGGWVDGNKSNLDGDGTHVDAQILWMGVLKLHNCNSVFPVTILFILFGPVKCSKGCIILCAEIVR